jgi:hypothetical protein
MLLGGREWVNFRVARYPAQGRPAAQKVGRFFLSEIQLFFRCEMNRVAVS